MVPLSAERLAAARRVLARPSLHSFRLSDQSLERRGRGVAAPADRRGAVLYRRLLARQTADDAAGMAWAGALSHADFGAS